MSDVIDRIRELLRAESVETVELAAEIDEKYQRMKDIMGRRQRLPADVVTKIVEYYGVDANWLLTGTGRMYRVPPDLLEEKMKQLSAKEAGMLSQKDLEWLDLGRQISKENRTRLQGIAASLAASGRRDKKDVNED